MMDKVSKWSYLRARFDILSSHGAGLFFRLLIVMMRLSSVRVDGSYGFVWHVLSHFGLLVRITYFSTYLVIKA